MKEGGRVMGNDGVEDISSLIGSFIHLKPYNWEPTSLATLTQTSIRHVKSAALIKGGISHGKLSRLVA